MFAKLLISIAVLGLVTGLSGCSGSSAPHGWLPNADEACRQAHGAWVEAVYRDPAGERKIEGELIAVSPETIYILGEDSLFALPTLQVARYRLAAYSSNHGWLTLWTVGGTLSTVSHGALLLISMPVWIIAGSIFTATQSAVPMDEFTSWSTLKLYSRFPQGLPSNADLNALHRKPGKK